MRLYPLTIIKKQKFDNSYGRIGELHRLCQTVTREPYTSNQICQAHPTKIQNLTRKDKKIMGEDNGKASHQF